MFLLRFLRGLRRVLQTLLSSDMVAYIAVRYQPDGTWVEQLYVVEGWRRKGYGRRLLGLLGGRVRAEVRGPAQGFYERCGFKKVEETR